ncbi:MAG: DUF2512 family protein [Tuberibacillus sp.]
MITNLILKLALSPIIIIICDLFTPNLINYNAVYEAIVIGLFVGIVNFAIEWLMLARGTLWVTTIIDFIVTCAIVFFGTSFYPDAFMSTLGALIVTVIISIMEFFLHSWLLRHRWQTKLVAK